MTPQEKALELCQKFGLTTLFSKEDNEGKTLSLDTSKRCALIVVDEIIGLQDGIFGTYWEDVRKHINKL